MKKLFLFFLFSGSLSAFSQSSQYAICYHNTPACMCRSGEVVIRDTAYIGKHYIELDSIEKRRWHAWTNAATLDTLRAICLVTLSSNGIAHARMGFVVIEQGKRPVYLDCRKRALKLPQVGWGYLEVNPNRNFKN